MLEFRGTYGLIPFAFAFTLVELPYIMVNSVLYVVPFYFLAGFRDGGFGYFLLAFFAYSSVIVSIGQAVAFAVGSPAIAQQVKLLEK